VGSVGEEEQRQRPPASARTQGATSRVPFIFLFPVVTDPVVSATGRRGHRGGETRVKLPRVLTHARSIFQSKKQKGHHTHIHQWGGRKITTHLGCSAAQCSFDCVICRFTPSALAIRSGCTARNTGMVCRCFALFPMLCRLVMDPRVLPALPTRRFLCATLPAPLLPACPHL